MPGWLALLIVIGSVLVLVVLILLFQRTSKAESIDGSDAEDYAAIEQYRLWKTQARSWSDVEELNDMIDEKLDRMIGSSR